MNSKNATIAAAAPRTREEIAESLRVRTRRGTPTEKLEVIMTSAGLDRVEAATVMVIGLGGVVLMSRLNSGLPSAGSDIYIEVLAGCIIGGVSAKGGEGRVFKMIGGVLVMGVISNGMNVAGLSEYWQYVAKGAILIVSVGVDAYRTTVALNKKSHTIRSSAANAAAAKH